MPACHAPTQDHLLAALPAGEFVRLSPHQESVVMPPGAALYESGGQRQHRYFPTTAIVSLRHVPEDGSTRRRACLMCDAVQTASRRPCIIGPSGQGRSLKY